MLLLVLMVGIGTMVNVHLVCVWLTLTILSNLIPILVILVPMILLNGVSSRVVLILPAPNVLVLLVQSWKVSSLNLVLTWLLFLLKTRLEIVLRLV